MHSEHGPHAPLGARPRLSDWYDLPLNEQALDFVVPRLQEDLPLNIDPFLLFNSEKEKYRELHEQLLSFMESVRLSVLAGRTDDAHRLLEGVNEPVEIGLGYSEKNKRGRAFGPKIRRDIVALFGSVPQLLNGGMTHVEALSLLVADVAEDRISDLTASVIREYLIAFSSEQASAVGLPVLPFNLDNVWESSRQVWRPMKASLPFNPVSGSPLLLAPKDLLRTLPFINYDDYYSSTFAPLVLPPRVKGKRPKPAVLEYNRRGYDLVEHYISRKESAAEQCRPRDLFRPASKETLRRKLVELEKLPTGKEDGADKKYESLVEDLLVNFLNPELDFAQSQSRTISGSHVRDLIFYNDAKTPFTNGLRSELDCRQIVVELKNVASVSGEHVNQAARYLSGSFGRFGVILTRRAPSRSMLQNTADLHSSQRKAVVFLTDDDLRTMLECLDNGRRPIDVLKRSYVYFQRLLPN